MLHHFAVCHFHHDAPARKAQWSTLSALFDLLPPETIFLSDHNSVILPSRDVSCPRTSEEPADIIEARKIEVDVITRLGLLDAFVCLH